MTESTTPAAARRAQRRTRPSPGRSRAAGPHEPAGAAGDGGRASILESVRDAVDDLAERAAPVGPRALGPGGRAAAIAADKAAPAGQAGRRGDRRRERQARLEVARAGPPTCARRCTAAEPAAGSDADAAPRRPPGAEPPRAPAEPERGARDRADGALGYTPRHERPPHRPPRRPAPAPQGQAGRQLRQVPARAARRPRPHDARRARASGSPRRSSARRCRPASSRSRASSTSWSTRGSSGRPATTATSRAACRSRATSPT